MTRADVKAAALAAAIAFTPLGCGAAMLHKAPEPRAPYVFQEDDPGWCVGRPFPCGVWPTGTPNHEGALVVIDSAPAYAQIGG